MIINKEFLMRLLKRGGTGCTIKAVLFFIIKDKTFFYLPGAASGIAIAGFELSVSKHDTMIK